MRLRSLQLRPSRHKILLAVEVKKASDLRPYAWPNASQPQVVVEAAASRRFSFLKPILNTFFFEKENRQQGL